MHARKKYPSKNPHHLTFDKEHYHNTMCVLYIKCSVISNLPLQWNPRLTQNDFFVSPSNESAFEWIVRWPWPFENLWIFGPTGCGKTHLATLWAARQKAVWLTPWNESSDLDMLTSGSCAIVDWNNQAAEQMDPVKLYAFLMRLQEMRIHCLWLSRTSAMTWHSPLADVNSRIHAMVRVEITAPDDVLLAKILEKSFCDIGWKVNPRLIHFLIRRMPRSFAGVAEMIDLVHQHSTSSGLSISGLKSILESLQDME